MDGRARLKRSSPATSPKRSLERSLSRALAFAVVALGIAATALAFAFGFDQAQDLRDEALRQIALLAAAPSGRLPPASAEAPTGSDFDPEQQVVVVALSSAAVPMRVYVHGAPGGRIAVVQSTAVRRESALSSAAITAAPLLAPLRRLASGLGAQLAHSPQPLPLDGVPVEVASFIDAINRPLARVNELISVERRFIADAAHELRTPLTALAVQAGNLQQAHSAQEGRDRIDALKAGIERARHPPSSYSTSRGCRPMRPSGTRSTYRASSARRLPNACRSPSSAASTSAWKRPSGSPCQRIPRA